MRDMVLLQRRMSLRMRSIYLNPMGTANRHVPNGLPAANGELRRRQAPPPEAEVEIGEADVSGADANDAEEDDAEGIG